MNLRKSLTALTVTALLGITACSSNAPETVKAPAVESAAESEPSATATESAAPAAERSKRGNLVKDVGVVAGTFDAETKEQLASFVVNAIEVDPVCTAPRAAENPPENGHFIALDVSIETFEALGKNDYPPFSLNPASMKVIAPNGTTSNASLNTSAAWSCFDDAQIIPASGLGPAEKVTGKLVLDSEVASGVLVITDGGPNGWEYTFGATPPNA